MVAPLIFSRYRQAGIIPGWGVERVRKLAHLSNRTVEELGAMAGLMPSETRTAMKRGLFSPPVSLHFAMIDAALRSAKFGEPSEPIVPLEITAEKET
jgi:hypothetical protein